MRPNTWMVLAAVTTILPAIGACTEHADVDRITAVPAAAASAASPRGLDADLQAYLSTLGFTGRVGSTLESRLGRHIDHQLADIGRQLWFDPIHGLNNDNTCAGCHSPTNGFGDTQPIAIGIDNNRIVGPGRMGPRNQRRAPMMINTAFYPTLMWNSRFSATSGDPFDNSHGFAFPAPEGRTLSYLPHLLTAQAFIPPTERTEAAGFHFPGDNDDIRAEVVRRLNASENYRETLRAFVRHVKAGAPDHVRRFRSRDRRVRVHASLCRRANRSLRTRRSQRDDGVGEARRGSLLRQGRMRLVPLRIRRVERDVQRFPQHVAGVPQIAPSFGNVTFDGPGANEDFGLEQVTGNPADRYAFRTSPLRNVALQPAFMHNGAFVRLEDAVRYPSGRGRRRGVVHHGPSSGGPARSNGSVAARAGRLDPALRKPVALTDDEFESLVDFLRDGLLDPGARPQRLRRLIPDKLPSGRAPFRFEFPDHREPPPIP